MEEKTNFHVSTSKGTNPIRRSHSLLTSSNSKYPFLLQTPAYYAVTASICAGEGVAQIFSSQQKKIFWYWKENVLLAEYWLSLSKSTKLNFQVIDPIVCLSPEQRCKHCWECIVCLNRMWEIRVSALVGLDGSTTSPEIANKQSFCSSQRRDWLEDISPEGLLKYLPNCWIPFTSGVRCWGAIYAEKNCQGSILEQQRLSSPLYWQSFNSAEKGKNILKAQNYFYREG